jgi:hypothetical protein
LLLGSTSSWPIQRRRSRSAVLLLGLRAQLIAVARGSSRLSDQARHLVLLASATVAVDRQRLLELERRTHRPVCLSLGAIEVRGLLLEHGERAAKASDIIDRDRASEQFVEQYLLAFPLPVAVGHQPGRGRIGSRACGFALGMLARERTFRALQARLAQGQQFLQIARLRHATISCSCCTATLIDVASSNG